MRSRLMVKENSSSRIMSNHLEQSTHSGKSYKSFAYCSNNYWRLSSNATGPFEARAFSASVLNFLFYSI